jgi:hypothetical protein
MSVYPKYSGLGPPSLQQLWLREASADGGTTMSSESVCQVAPSWADVGSSHKAFSGEIYEFYGVSSVYFGYKLVFYFGVANGLILSDAITNKLCVFMFSSLHDRRPIVYVY